MLMIRQEQMAVFEDYLWQRYVRALVTQALAEAPEIGAGKTLRELCEMVTPAVRRAAAHGILIEADVTRYGRLVLRLGRDLESDEGSVGAALRDPELMGSEKLDALELAAR